VIKRRLKYYGLKKDEENEQGNLVSSGVYFYQLKTGDLAETKKLVLLK
jgi:hypothetical protein